jgi:3-hydroxyanthranilate 3,4-dioxygenase
VKIQEDGKSVEVPIRAGEMFLLPPRIPHSPIRSEGSVGLVIERVRKPEHQDGLLWFCDECNQSLYETYFQLGNIENDFLPRFRHFYSSETLRTCSNCSHTMETDTRFT